MKAALTSSLEKLRQLERTSRIIGEHSRIFAPQHPELLLLSYLAKKKKFGEYPYSYIGLAKPPCLICGVIFLGSKDYNAMSARASSCRSCVTVISYDLPGLARGLIFTAIDRLAGRVSQTFIMTGIKIGGMIAIGKHGMFGRNFVE